MGFDNKFGIFLIVLNAILLFINLFKSIFPRAAFKTLFLLIFYYFCIWIEIFLRQNYSFLARESSDATVSEIGYLLLIVEFDKSDDLPYVDRSWSNLRFFYGVNSSRVLFRLMLMNANYKIIKINYIWHRRIFSWTIP